MNELTRRRFLQLAAGVGAVSAVPALRAQAMADDRDGAPGLPAGEWLAGDFHVHTTYSHDVWSGPGDDNTDAQDFYTLGWTPAEQIEIATTRLLDFVALTDHNRLDALHDAGYASDRLVLVPGYEHSLAGGHAGVFVPSVAALPRVLKDPTGGTGFNGDAGIRNFIDQVHALGGMTTLNHPFGGAVWKYNIPPSVGMDAVEVWNSHWLARDDTVQFAASNNHRSIEWWEQRFLFAGLHKPAVGGSDNHWRSTTAVQGVGQPTTWVYARERSAAAIIEGVQRGRTTVSQNPLFLGGARLRITATEDWGAANAAMVGGALRWDGPLHVDVQVENGEGKRLRLVSTGHVVGEQWVASPRATHHASVVLPEHGWLRAELYDDPGFLMAAITSPIYASPDRAPADVRGRVATSGPPVGYGSPDLTIPDLPEFASCC